jgi:hypothetical protein
MVEKRDKQSTRHSATHTHYTYNQNSILQQRQSRHGQCQYPRKKVRQKHEGYEKASTKQEEWTQEDSEGAGVVLRVLADSNTRQQRQSRCGRRRQVRAAKQEDCETKQEE